MSHQQTASAQAAPENLEVVLKVENLTKQVNSPEGLLTIVRDVVTQNGGSVRVEDALGGGARFVVTLPAVTGPPQGLEPVSEIERGDGVTVG